MQARKRIVASVISDLATDQRVQRICNSLQQMGFDVHVIARQFNNSLPLQQYSFSAERIHCIFRKGFLQYAEFNAKLFFRLLRQKKDLLLSNDLDTLLPNFLISRLQKKNIVYDTHEYFVGVAELRNSPFKKWVWQKIEGIIFPKLKTVYTVNESIREIYGKQYNIDLGVIRNVPVTLNVDAVPMPDDWKAKKLLMLQGGGINKGRGGLETLEAMKYLPDEYLLIMIGGGTEWEEIKQKRVEWQLEGKCQMIGRMLPNELKAYTKLAWAGISPDKKDDMNYLYVLPNKIFDYIHAGVPIIASDNPEVKSIVEKYNCGKLIANVSAQEIANAVLNLAKDSIAYNSLKQNCAPAAKELCWEKESEKLAEIYKQYL